MHSEFRHACALAILAALQPFQAFSADPQNLIRNGQFDQLEKGRPVGWATSGNASVKQSLEIVSDDGNPYAKLTCTHFENKSPASHAMLAQQAIALQEGRLYELTCRARAEGLRGRSVHVAITDTATWQNGGLQADLRLSSAWRPFRKVFRATRTLGPQSRLQIWYVEPGTLCIDDLRLVEIGEQDAAFTHVIPALGGKNLVPNASFELGAAGWSSLGQGAGWGNLPKLHGAMEKAGATEGDYFLRIALGGENTPVLYFDYLRPIMHRELSPLAANLGWIPVEKGRPYTLSCDMRASTDGVPAIVGVKARDGADEMKRARGPQYQNRVTLTREWKRYSTTFRPDRPYVFVTVGPSLAEEKNVDVDIDAVQLERGEKPTAFETRGPLEVRVEPATPSGIFTQMDRPALRVHAYNRSEAARSAQVRFACSDFFDRPAALQSLRFDVPAHSALQREIELPKDWKGYYNIEAVSEAGGTTDSMALRVAIVPAPVGDDSILGINHAFANPYLIHEATRAGVFWYRDWSLKWQDLEPEPGQFHWEVSDTQINRVLREGVRLMALLPPFPSANWSSEASPDLPTKGYPGSRLREAWGPKDPAKLGEFVSRVVSRYKDRVKVWEFLNEPLYTDYALPGEGHRNRYPGPYYTPKDYVRLLAVAAAGMKRGDPDCLVMGGISGHPTHTTREIIEAGCLEHLDILNLHMYPAARIPESFLPEMDMLLGFMDTHGGRKPIWITEFSYYGADNLPRRPFIAARDSWAEVRLLDSERECAEFTLRYLIVMLARGVEKVFIHAGTNNAANEDNFNCCLFADGAVPRKVLPALAVFTSLMGAKPKCAGEKIIGEQAYAFAFETGERAVAALWIVDEDSSGPVTIRVPDGAACLDAMGRKIEGPVRLSTTPIYLIGESRSAASLLDVLTPGIR